MDTWILLRNTEYNGERNRTLYVLKSRGMQHSNQVREFILNDKGIDLIDVYVGEDKVLTGTARIAQEETERMGLLARSQDHKRRMLELDRKRKTIRAQIAALQAELGIEEEEVKFQEEQEIDRLKGTQASRDTMASLRGVNHGKRHK